MWKKLHPCSPFATGKQNTEHAVFNTIQYNSTHSNFPHLRRTTAIASIQKTELPLIYVPRSEPIINTMSPNPLSSEIWKKLQIRPPHLSAKAWQQRIRHGPLKVNFMSLPGVFVTFHLRHPTYGIWVHYSAFTMWYICVIICCIPFRERGSW